MTNIAGFLWVIGISIVIILAVLLMIWGIVSSVRRKRRVQPAMVHTQREYQSTGGTPMNVIVHEAHSQELIAVITAAIAASLNTSTYRLNIKSIKRADAHAPTWGVAGRNELINNRF